MPDQFYLVRLAELLIQSHRNDVNVSRFDGIINFETAFDLVFNKNHIINKTQKKRVKNSKKRVKLKKKGIICTVICN